MAFYNVNKGIGRETEFKGFSGTYIYYLAGVALGSFFLFIILYFIGLPNLVALILVVTIFLVSTLMLYRTNKKHGLNGLAQQSAKKRRKGAIQASVSPFTKIPRSHKPNADGALGER